MSSFRGGSSRETRPLTYAIECMGETFAKYDGRSGPISVTVGNSPEWK
jgi:hypothetical protein